MAGERFRRRRRPRQRGLQLEVRGWRDLITVVGHTAPIGAGEFMGASTHGVYFRSNFLRSAPTTSWPDLSAQVIRFLISESVSQNRIAYGLAPAVRPLRPVSRSYAGLRCSTLII
jgi:hypothetical protein